jgi:hypothetical protein
MVGEFFFAERQTTMNKTSIPTTGCVLPPPMLHRPKRATRNPNPDYTGKGGVRLKHLIDGYGSSLCELCEGNGCKPVDEGDTSCLANFTKEGTARKW